jgi:hypothetical protein
MFLAFHVSPILAMVGPGTIGLFLLAAMSGGSEQSRSTERVPTR